MAGLFFSTHRMEVSAALSGVGELKFAISNELKNIGFTDVVINSAEVAGNRNDVRVSIAHLPNSDGSFWQVFMAGGGAAFNVIQQTHNEVVDKVRKLKFL